MFLTVFTFPLDYSIMLSSSGKKVNAAVVLLASDSVEKYKFSMR